MNLNKINEKHNFSEFSFCNSLCLRDKKIQGITEIEGLLIYIYEPVERNLLAIHGQVNIYLPSKALVHNECQFAQLHPRAFIPPPPHSAWNESNNFLFSLTYGNFILILTS